MYEYTVYCLYTSCYSSYCVSGLRDSHLTSIVQNSEHQFVFVLFGFCEFNMTRVCVVQLVHKGNVSGFGEPALLIQQGQDAWRVVLQVTEDRRLRYIPCAHYFTHPHSTPVRVDGAATGATVAGKHIWIFMHISAKCHPLAQIQLWSVGKIITLNSALVLEFVRFYTVYDLLVLI